MLKLKLRIFRPCRSKDTSTTPPEKPPPPRQRHKVTAIDFTCTTSPPPPPSKQPHHRSAFKTHLCSAFPCGSTSVNHSASASASEDDLQPHIVDSPRSKIYNSSAVAGILYDQGRVYVEPRFTTVYDDHKQRIHKSKNRRLRKPITTAISPDSDQFTTKYIVNENEQQSKIISSFSRSFSTEYNSPSNNCKVKKRRSREKGGGGGLSPECGSPARLSVFMKIMPCKVKESFAVVKRSKNPYEDFKKSMVEMIVEKEIMEESDLTQLLQCFLSLNSRYHHGVIMEAFSEIWDTMFLDQYRTFGI